MRAKGLLNYRLRFCWLKVICCLCQSNENEHEIEHRTGGPKLGTSQKPGVTRLTQASLKIATACT